MSYRLSGRDYRDLLETVDIIYSGSGRSMMLLALFERIERWIGICSAVYLPLDVGSGTFEIAGSVNYHIEEGVFRIFFSPDAPVHPLVDKKLHLTTANESLRLTDYVPPSRLRDTAWGRDFQPQIPIFYELSANLAHAGAAVAGLALHRNRGDRDFSGRDVTVMNVLLPHISRSLNHFDLMNSEVPSQEHVRKKLTGLGLTRREEGVAMLVIGGLSNKDIAARLFIGEMTVKDHLKSIFRKTEIRRRGELAGRVLGPDMTPGTHGSRGSRPLDQPTAPHPPHRATGMRQR